MLIKRDVDGKAQSFPNGEIPAIIGTFTYTAKRKGGAPSITATIYYPTPLDKRWTHEEYVEFQGERYYATSIPSSSKDNQSVLYKHGVTFTSRREVLDNTLFFDAVSNKDEDTNGGDKYRTNQTKFSFGGDITEFVSRINSSMKYCGVPYSVVIDDGYATTDVKEVSFENQYLTQVLQLINTTYQLDYYWVGNVCHVGKLQYDLTDSPIEYGRNDALVSVSKENSNARIVDMITGYGSSDNIPYYYPNDDEFGKVLFDTENFDKALVTNVSLGKLLKWDSNIYGKTLTLCKNTSESYQGDIFKQSKYNVCVSENVAHIADAISSGVGLGSKNVTPTCSLGEKVITGFGSRDTTALVGSSIIWLLFEFNGNAGDTIRLDGLSFSSSEAAGSNRLGLEFKYEQVCYVGEGMDMDAAFAAMSSAYVATIKRDDNGYYTKDKLPSSRYWAFGDSIGSEFSDYTKSYDKTCTLIKSGKMVVVIGCKVTATNINVAKGTRKMSTVTTTVTGDVLYSHKPQSVYFFENEDGGTIAYDESGIGINDIDSIPNKSLSFVFDGTDWNASRGNADKASKIRVNGRTWIFPSQNLMPSIYRESGGAERFYYAKDGTYSIPGTTDKYAFKNVYKEGNPHQGSVEFSDIKPTINGVRNDVIQSDGLGQLFGEIADVAFDRNDSDVKNDDSEYIHSYFYIKLHKFSGSYGFDLFKHALASESAKINLIKSNGCPACSFDIQCVPSKDKSKMYNCVSTDGHGNLKSVRDDCNDYIFKNDEDAYKDTFNQDSTKTELWIAVKKDDSTLGIIMPNASGNFKPQKGDLFVITGINPPKVLVTAAEKRLDEALIKYMSENNEDKFNYSVKFSRIFLQENMAFANKLNENSKVAIIYAGEKHEFFVTNYTVKVDDSALADVEIELSDTLDASSSELKKAIDAVKGETVAQLQGLIGGSGGLNATVADRLYLSKQGDDTAQGLITFAKGLVAKAVANLRKGAKFGNNAFITELGNAALNTVRSIDYDNAAEQGFSIEKDAGGRYQAFLTNLTVWGKAVFHELEIRKLSYAGGDIYLSGAGSKIIRVVPVKRGTATSGTSSTVTWVACDADDKDCVGWKCWLLADDGTTATMNYWQEGDQARCRTMGEIILSGSYENTANRSYWRTIPDGGVSTENEKIYGKKVETYTDADGKEQTRETEVELYDGQRFGWIVIGKHSAAFDGVTEGDTHTMDLQDIPQAGDTIVLDGNRHRGSDGNYDKTDRQNVILLETSGEYAPRIACFANITEYKHTVTRNGKEVSLSVFETSPKGGTKINSSMFEFVADDGSMANILNYRGDWSSASTYHKNDQVNHNNAVWVCVANSGVDVKEEEPSDTSNYWKKVLTGGKGGTSYGVTLTVEKRTISSVEDDCLVVTFTKGDTDGVTTTNNVQDIGGYAQLYVDGKIDTSATARLNLGTSEAGELQKGAFPQVFTAGYVTVKWYDKEGGTLLGTGSLTRGADGKDATVYGVQVSSYSEWISSDNKLQGLQFGFTKTTGTTVEKYTDVTKMGCTVKIYGDDTLYDNVSGWINEGNDNFLFSSFPYNNVVGNPTLADKSVISVELYHDDVLLATANYANGKQGDGVVMAYKHADTQPDVPTGTDPEYPGDGWSLSPDATTAGEKVTGVSYGGYESGTYDGTNKGTDATAKEWAEAEDDGRTWMKSPSGLGDNFGYALMKVSFTTQYDNTTVDVEIKAYSEQNYDLVEVWALDTAPDTGTTFRGQGLAHASGNGVEQAYSFTVAKAGRHFICVTYAKDISGNDNGDYGLFRLDLSDNEVAVSDTVWMSQAKVSGGKCVLPWSTPVKINGADGMGALEISVAPDTLVFDTNDNGIVPSATSKTATIACYRDGKKVTNVEYDLTKDGHPDCSASISTSNSTATVTISKIATDEPYGVSKTCGTVEVQVYDIDNGRYYFPTVKFSVNVAKFNGGLKADNKRLESNYSELTNNGSITDLKEYRSEILQSAREISLHVSEKRAGRRNLLPGSAFRKQGEGPFVNNTLNLISVNGGYDGTNCIRATNTYPGSGEGLYVGAFWDGSQKASSIKIERGKKYTISVWAKCDNVNAKIALETIFTDKLTSAKRMGKRPKSTTWGFKVSKAGEWQLLQCTIDTSLFYDGTANTLYDCLAVNVFCNHQLTDAGGNGLTVNAWFCRPMLEEGNEYNGWTLSEQDYDYVGGNLLDGTATLAKTGNVEVLNPDNVTQGGMGESASIKAELLPTVKEVDFLQFSTANMGLKANEDYVLSFYAKTEGNAGKLQCYLYPSKGYTNTEDSESGHDNSWNPSDGHLWSEIVPGTQWKRYWAHWRPTKADPQHVLFRLLRGGNDRGTYSSYTTYAVDDVVLYDGTYYRCIMAGQGNTPSSSSSYWDATKYGISLSQPKLEVGATMTEWTAKRADMVDKQALYATGIDIDSKKITLTADHTYVRTNDGTPMVLIDADGNLTNVKVNADMVNVSATHKLSISGNGSMVVDMDNFKLDESGNASFKGSIDSKSGTISFFTFTDSGMYSATSSSMWGLGLRATNISVRGTPGGRTSLVCLGNGQLDTTGGNDSTFPTSVVNGQNVNYCNLIQVTGGGPGNGRDAAALGIETQGDYCLSAMGGLSHLQGLALDASTISGSANRTLFLCSSSSFTMPSNPKAGQLVIVIQTTGTGITFYGGGKSFMKGASTSSTAKSGTAGQWNFFVYDGSVSCWRCVYANGGLF